MKITMAMIKAANKKSGGHYFTKNQERIHGTKWYRNPGNGPFFFSQQEDFYGNEGYAIAKAKPNGRIDHLNLYPSFEKTRKLVIDLNKRWHRHNA